MQFLPFLTILATALAGQSFNALLIRSGSQYQYSSFKPSGSDIVAGPSGDLKLVLNSDGSLIDTISKKYIHIGDDKAVTLADKAQTGYSFEGNYLAFNGNSGFDVCSGAKIYFDTIGPDCLGVAVRAFGPEQTSDVSGSSSSATSTTSISTTHSSTASSAPQVKAVSSGSTSVSSAQPSATSAVQPGKKFGLIAIHSGSSVQNAGIKKVPEHPHVFSVGGSEGEYLTLTFDSDSSSLVDQDGRGINLDPTTGELGDVAPFGRQPATKGFSIEDGHLTFNGNSGWKACPSGNNTFSLTNKDCTGGIDIALRVVTV
ncbi:hypothetical protein JCM33374_g6051 [Metschnikowia sp. JCM 33374]|nr:hypothetical protein JCM33374_g6051 [Metschnikowia sp. JCM 33374]